MTRVVMEATFYLRRRGGNPSGRLQALARYLDVDWAWIQDRCRNLARMGTAGLLRPRSRHISTTGVDTHART